MQKAILFDLDGVVIDSENTVWLNSSKKLLSNYGKTYNEKDVAHLTFGTKFEHATRVVYDFYHIFEQDSFENFLTMRRSLVRESFSNKVMFMKGFTKFFKRIELRKKAIATSLDPEFLQLTLQQLPLRLMLVPISIRLQIRVEKQNLIPMYFFMLQKK